ncbi:GSCFA domain-containing protein [Saccharicrinis carchari]|nr:GSCFA domain-containing protein [Saccharicrinis carchari]
MFLGSCFANNMGSKFSECKLGNLINPFGVIYNPISVGNSLSSIIHKKVYSDTDLQNYNNRWLSFDHHSSFSDSNKSKCLKKINESIQEAAEFLKECEFVFFTFGTAWVYQLKETNQVVSNCHKYPDRCFNRYLLSIDEVVDKYKTLMKQLRAFNPDIKVIFTLSPVRHWKDGAHENQISKSILMLAIDRLCTLFDNCDYFPAYELLLDDLRDYRFYADDMLHPSASAITYIWEKFEDCFFSVNTLEYKKEMLKLTKALNHTPFDVKSVSHQVFLKKQLKKIEEYISRYPHIDFTKDLATVKSQIT